MKIIGGQWKGQALPSRSTLKMRPTRQKVREALFSSLESRMPTSWSELFVLDLFAGSGAFGFECLSRGASFSYFVENHMAQTKALKAQLRHWSASDRSYVMAKDAVLALKDLERKGLSVDLVFADPPYEEDWANPLIEGFTQSKQVLSQALIVVELSAKKRVSWLNAFEERGLQVLMEKKYSENMLFYACFPGSPWAENF